MRVNRYTSKFLAACLLACLCLLVLTTATASAITAIPTPDPKAGSYGLEATKKQPPPTTGANITVPGSGASFSTAPIKVSGICPDKLLVQVYNNGVMVGSVYCEGGSFSLEVSLFTGQNDLTASVFDDLDQTGPPSNLVTVTYNNATLTAFGSVMTLSSTYGRRAANPGTELVWPLVLSGGSGPYAFSIDWGDGTPSQLKSQGSTGEVKIAHVYKKAGVYYVSVKVTDVNGVSAFIQLTAIANGQVTNTAVSNNGTKNTTITKVMWLPMAVGFALLFPTYWLGRKSQLVTLHKQLQKSVDSYKEL